MKTQSLNSSSWRRSSAWARGVALASLAAGAWALSIGTAHARGGNDVYWSVGVSQPGVSVGVSNMPPPRVVVMEPRPVVIERRPVLVERPVRYERPVVVVREPVYYRDYGPRWHKRYDRRWHARHGHGYRYDDRFDDRYDHRR
jgi:hypothetical protein